MVDVSVIIINYNTPEITLQCINSIFKENKDIRIEIILVDNASTESSYNLFKNNDNIIYIYNNENIGFGKGNNLGATHSKGKYLFFLNSDTILINNAIKILYNYMENNNNIGICGANLYNYNRKPTHSYLTYFPSIKSELRFLIPFANILFHDKSWQFNYTNNVIDVSYICGADIFIKKTLFDSVNGFDKDFFMYYEEAELAYRIKSKGYKIRSVPQAKIIHLEGKSNVISEFKIKVYLTSRYTFFNKVYGYKTAKISFYTLQLIYLISTILSLIKFNFNRFKENINHMRVNYFIYKTKY